MSQTKPTAPPALLQFEIDRTRWKGHSENFNGMYDENPSKRLYNLAKTAVCDTIYNGGTFVLVATPDKITIVQRADVEEL